MRRSRSGSRDHNHRRSFSRSSSPEEFRIHIADLGISPSKSLITKAFEKYGTILDFWLAKNPPCFAFIKYKYQEEADDAIRDMDGKTISGGRVRVSYARPRTRGRNRRGFDPNLRCYQCGERGHFSRDCSEVWKNRNRSRSRSKDRRREKRRRSYSRSRSRSRSPKRRSSHNSLKDRRSSDDRAHGEKRDRKMSRSSKSSSRSPKKESKSTEKRETSRSASREKSRSKSPEQRPDENHDKSPVVSRNGSRSKSHERSRSKSLENCNSHTRTPEDNPEENNSFEDEIFTVKSKWDADTEDKIMGTSTTVTSLASGGNSP